MGAISRLKERVRRWKLARRAPSEIFSGYYRSNKWGDKHSRSGKGSNLEATADLRRLLPPLVAELGARSFLDLPCGDYFWMRHVDLAGVAYHGADIVPEMIARNQAGFGSDRVRFSVINLIEGPVPRHDIMFVRDCLVHLSNAHLSAALRNIKASGSTWLLTTTYPESFSNTDISTGQWRAIDLTRVPYNLPAPERLIAEGCASEKGQQPDKSLGLWRVADLPDLML